MKYSRAAVLHALTRVWVIGLLGIPFPDAASAQIGRAGIPYGLKDPTRPPAQFLGPAELVQDATLPDSGLQTIKRTGNRYRALLNGEWIKPGDRSGDAVVARIGEHKVVLQYPDGRRETIGMYPEVELRSRKGARRVTGR